MKRIALKLQSFVFSFSKLFSLMLFFTLFYVAFSSTKTLASNTYCDLKQRKCYDEYGKYDDISEAPVMEELSFSDSSSGSMKINGILNAVNKTYGWGFTYLDGKHSSDIVGALFVCNKGAKPNDSSCTNKIAITVENYWNMLEVEILKDGTIIEHGNKHNGKWAWPWTPTSDLIEYVDKTNSLNFYDKLIKNKNFEKNGFRIYLHVENRMIYYYYYADTNYFTEPTATISTSSSGWQKEYEVTFSASSNNPNNSLYIAYCVSTYSTLNAKKGNYLVKSSDNNQSCSLSKTYSDTTKTIKENGIKYVYLYVMDSNNGEWVLKKLEIKVDNVEPSITYTPPTKSPTDWAKSHTVSNVNVSDSASGVKSRYYCWSTSIAECKGGTWQSFTENDKSISGSGYTGEYYLLIKAEDNAGNVKQVVITTVGETNTDQGSTGSGSSGGSSGGGSSGIGGGSGKNFEKVMLFSMKTDSLEEIVKFRFDNEAPTLNIEIENSDKGLSSNKWTNNTNFRANIVDNHSGLASARLQWKEGISKGSFPSANEIDLLENNSFDWTTYIADISNGLYIKVILTDNVGNSHVETMSLYIDNVAPVVNIKTGVNKLGVQKTWLNLSDVILYEITIGDSNFKSMTYTNLSDKCEAVADTGTTKRNLTVRCKKGVASFKLEYEVVDKAGNKNINSASYGDNQSVFNFDTNGVTLKDGDVEIGGTIEANGFFPSKSSTTKANLVTYEVEEIELVDVEVVSEDTPAVVNDEEVKTIEVSANIEEHKELDSKVIELGNSEICVTNIKFSYANEELKKLFILNKKLNKWVVSKK